MLRSSVKFAAFFTFLSNQNSTSDLCYDILLLPVRKALMNHNERDFNSLYTIVQQNLVKQKMGNVS